MSRIWAVASDVRLAEVAHELGAVVSVSPTVNSRPSLVSIVNELAFRS